MPENVGHAVALPNLRNGPSIIGNTWGWPTTKNRIALGHLYSFQVRRLDVRIRVIKALIAANSGFYRQDRQRGAREAGH